jgi:hypothetical protein
MLAGPLVLVRTQSAFREAPPRRRERRSGRARRAEDGAANYEPAAPSLGFLAQVINQARPAEYEPRGAYARPSRLRCGVCADERA